MKTSLKFFAVSLLFMSVAHASDDSNPSTPAPVAKIEYAKSAGRNFVRGGVVGILGGAAYLTAGRLTTITPAQGFLVGGASVQVANEFAPRVTKNKTTNRGLDVSAHVAGVVAGGAVTVLGAAVVLTKIKNFFQN